MNVIIIIPTYNGGYLWSEVANKIKENNKNNIPVLVVDSGSKDDTVKVANELGFEIKEINKENFNHGGTRNAAVFELEKKYDIAIFLTQDAIPEPLFLENIIKTFDDEEVSCAYGRQIPHDNATLLAKHARHFNYPIDSHVYVLSDSCKYGIKTVFNSNSFSAYRISIFEELGGFPTKTILSEDMYYAAKSIIAGYKVSYVSSAVVKHSHNYSIKEEFKRYFDIGVFHKEQSWIKDKFGSAGGEGKKFVISEIKYLWKRSPTKIPSSIMRNFFKLLGFKIGCNYERVPDLLKEKISMHKMYWKNE